MREKRGRESNFILCLSDLPKTQVQPPPLSVEIPAGNAKPQLISTGFFSGLNNSKKDSCTAAVYLSLKTWHVILAFEGFFTQSIPDSLWVPLFIEQI